MVPVEVTEAIAALKADVIVIGGAMFIVILAVVAFSMFRRVAK